MKNVTGKSVKTALTVVDFYCGHNPYDPCGATLLYTRDRKWVMSGRWANIMEVIDDPEGDPGPGYEEGLAEITPQQAYALLAQDSEQAVMEAERYVESHGFLDPFKRRA